MKRTAFAAGISAAVMISGLLWMFAILTGTEISGQVYTSIAVTIAFTVPMLNWLKDGLLTLSAELHDEVKKWLALTAKPPAPAVVAPAPQRTDVLESILAARAHGHKTSEWVFFNNGNRVGFTHSALGGTMPEGQWARWCRHYASPAGQNVLRLEPGAQGYVLNEPTWTHEAVMKAVEDGSLPPPFPNEEPVKITPARNDATRQRAKRRATPATE